MNSIKKYALFLLSITLDHTPLFADSGSSDLYADLNNSGSLDIIISIIAVVLIIIGAVFAYSYAFGGNKGTKEDKEMGHLGYALLIGGIICLCLLFCTCN